MAGSDFAVRRDRRELYVNETEIKPNLYAANVISGIVGVIAIVFLLNELGVFEVDRLFVHICLTVSILFMLLMRRFIKTPAWLKTPACKYVVMGMVLLLVLTLNVLLNIHAVLALVLPILLATQYRSLRVSAMALAGACVCCFTAPVLSYYLNTWSLDFLTGYMETFCHVTVSTAPGNTIMVSTALWEIALYWALPQALTLLAFGLILFSATRSGIHSVKDQLHIRDLSDDLDAKLASIMQMQEQVLFAMSDIIESRDIETGGHVKRTSEIVRVLMDALQDDPQSGVTPDFCSNVIKVAPMHDIGKIAVPDTILRKPGRLTAAEYAIVQGHPTKSAEIIVQALTGLEDEALLTTAANIARYHHERVDGTGYPERLKGEEIPLEARIMAIADVYDALVSERCYKAPMSFAEAFRTIEECMGTQFDPALEPYFAKCRESIEALYRT